jgi:hypothetical protein
MIECGRSRSYDAITALAITGGKPIQVFGYIASSAIEMPK